jgi:hypothetical protein
LLKSLYFKNYSIDSWFLVDQLGNNMRVYRSFAQVCMVKAGNTDEYAVTASCVAQAHGVELHQGICRLCFVRRCEIFLDSVMVMFTDRRLRCDKASPIFPGPQPCPHGSGSETTRDRFIRNRGKNSRP